MQTGAIRRSVFLMVCVAATPVVAQAQVPANSGFKPTSEPVLRVSKKPDVAPTTRPSKAHPLDPALKLAYDGLSKMRERVQDYTATMVKRERINGRLGNEEYMFVKIRNQRNNPNQSVPFSIYMRFLKPEKINGREVIWVENRDDNKLIAHDTGLIRGSIRVKLDPEGGMAMKGNRYPIHHAGLENLVVKLIEKAERDRAAGQCEVEFFKSKIAGRSCTLIQVTHPEQQDPYDFHIAKVYIDDQLQIPVRYAAFSWPRRPNGDPVLEEEYTYLDVKLNVGLSELDFDPDNPKYDFP